MYVDSKAEHLMKEITETVVVRCLMQCEKELPKNFLHYVCKPKMETLLRLIEEKQTESQNDDEGPIESFIGDPSPLTQRITED